MNNLKLIAVATLTCIIAGCVYNPVTYEEMKQQRDYEESKTMG